MAKKTYDLLFKLLLIGDSDTGKTDLLFRFSDDAFNTSFLSTIGIDFKIKTIQLGGKKIKLQMWDTAGQERFHTITSSYYRGALGILLVYSITNQKTFDSIPEWLRKLEGHGGHIEKILVGNNFKSDEVRQVPREQGEQLAALHGIPFIETNTVDNTNVEKAFLDLAQAILEKLPEKETEIDARATVYLGEETDDENKCF